MLSPVRLRLTVYRPIVCRPISPTGGSNCSAYANACNSTSVKARVSALIGVLIRWMVSLRTANNSSGVGQSGF